jgi:predicted dinucleotide-binding enzyme
VDSIAEAIAGSDIVVLAVPGSAVNDVVSGNAGLLNGKIVIDATNQRVKGQAEATGQWGERKTLNSLDVLQEHAPDAVVFRAFNSYSWEIFADPAFGDERADLFYAGPAGAGQAAVEQLIRDVGVHPVRVGGLEQVETVDNVLALWASLALFAGKGRDKIAFKVLER